MFGFVLFVLYDTDTGSQVMPSWDFDQQLRIAKASALQSGSVDTRLFIGHCQLLSK